MALTYLRIKTGIGSVKVDKIKKWKEMREEIIIDLKQKINSQQLLHYIPN